MLPAHALRILQGKKNQFNLTYYPSLPQASYDDAGGQFIENGIADLRYMNSTVVGSGR